MSSRQRMLSALSREKPGVVPCSFMMFNGLKAESTDYLDFIERQLDFGLDAYVQIPPRQPVVANDYYNLHGLPVNYDPRVKVNEWKETPEDQPYPILIKEYVTPAGTLRAEVRQDGGWRWGDHVPFLDDYLVGRSNKFIVDGPADLDALRYLLVPPTAQEIEAFKSESAPVLEFAHEHDLLVAGGWGIGADLIGWVFGLHRLPYTVFDDPDFVSELLGIIATWNRIRMEVLLQAGIDLFIKRAWYENCDNFTPRHYRQFIKPILEADVALAHQYDTKFGFMMTSNCMALLDDVRETGVDAIIGVDPEQWDLEETHRKLGGRVFMWGGVNGHLTVEMGKPEDVRAEVRRAIDILGSDGGFILSPVDNVREYTPTSRPNVAALIDEWKQITGQ
jgi:hypothetical protein